MANVTYLLGAGASYNALPVVDELPEAISDTMTALKTVLYDSAFHRDYSCLKDEKIKTGASNAIVNLKTLAEECKNHISIDTYAKMLYLTGNINKYNQSKATIILFFHLFKLFNKRINNLNRPEINGNKNRHTENLDKRYDAFLASILQIDYKSFPDNIRILSWNYDSQFEVAYHKYLVNAQTESKLDDLLNIYRKNEIELRFDTTKFGIYKINGGIDYHTNGKIITQTDTTKNDNESLREVLNDYLNSIRDPSLFTPGISFAWDSAENTHTLLENIKKATKDTLYLVVIGYSFPFFNRRIDYEIIRNMKGLRKIYIQDPNAEEIKDRIKAIKTEFQDPIQAEQRLISVPNTKQFYLPDELT